MDHAGLSAANYLGSSAAYLDRLATLGALEASENDEGVRIIEAASATGHQIIALDRDGCMNDMELREDMDSVFGHNVMKVLVS